LDITVQSSKNFNAIVGNYKNAIIKNKDIKFLQQAVAEIPWGHNEVIANHLISAVGN